MVVLYPEQTRGTKQWKLNERGLMPRNTGRKIVITGMLCSSLFYVFLSRVEVHCLTPSLLAGFLLILLFDPENEGDILRRNVGCSPNYMALEHRRQCSS